MREVRIYDPHRDPKSWSGLVAPGMFVAFGSDARKGHPLDANGVPRSSADATCLLFESFGEARAACEGLVAGSPAMQWKIFDHHGMAKVPVVIIQADELAPDVRRPGRARMLASALLLVVGTVLIAYDALHDFAKFYPALLGCGLFTAGIRVLMLGIGQWENARNAQRRLEEIILQEGSAGEPRATSARKDARMHRE